MLHRLRAGAHDERGFTLIELLVVILIIGILAAIAVPLFLNQKGKAQDTQGKAVARTAQMAMETYATNNNGSFAGADVSTLNSLEPSLITASSTAAYLASVDAPDSSDYTIVATSPITSSSFSVVNTAGSISRACSPGGTGGCPTDGTW